MIPGVDSLAYFPLSAMRPIQSPIKLSAIDGINMNGGGGGSNNNITNNIINRGIGGNGGGLGRRALAASWPGEGGQEGGGGRGGGGGWGGGNGRSLLQQNSLLGAFSRTHMFLTEDVVLDREDSPIRAQVSGAGCLVVCWLTQVFSLSSSLSNPHVPLLSLISLKPSL
jgi:hypothetical protein